MTDASGLRLDPAQVDGLNDMDPEAFRIAAHEVVDRIADYLETIETRPVLPPVEPGSIGPLFPERAPEAPEPLADILEDVDRLVLPNATHWQHPGFLAYFATTASGPGMLGEFLTAALGQNPMLWRTSPIGTELETVVVGWLRRALGLPATFTGLLTDTASTSTLIALAAAREAGGLDAAAHGLAATRRTGDPRVYASLEAHSSVEKACMTLGLGRDSVVKVAVTDDYRMDPDALAMAIEADHQAGLRPIAVVATIGTTSSTSADPVGAIADVAAREHIWLHVDAAYAGVVALIPERRAPFAGWERADSIVVNPHKWLFTPLDASLLLTRRLDQVRAAFSLTPEYLRTLDRKSPVLDLNEFQPQLGRRMRALKLWMVIRWFGLEGLRRRIEFHIELAERFAGWVDADPDWERMAPVPFSTVCFRYRPAHLTGREDEGDVPDLLDGLNTRLMDAVNRSGEVFLSHTRLRDRFAIRLSVGNLRTEPRHIERAWELLRGAARMAALPTTAAIRHEEGPMAEPIEILYFYRTRWGCHDEFVDLFRRNHWPILREQLAAGRYTAVEMWTPRFHGEGRADWDLLVSITYRDWAAIQEHSDARDRRAPVPRPGGVPARRAPPVRAARRPLGRRAGGAAARALRSDRSDDRARTGRSPAGRGLPDVARPGRVARRDDAVRDDRAGADDSLGLGHRRGERDVITADRRVAPVRGDGARGPGAA